MKKSKIFVFFIAFIAVGSISFYFTSFILNGKKSEESATIDQVKQNQSDSSGEATTNVKGTENELTKSDSNGSVTIKTTLLPEKSSSDQLVFEIVMNTHSVDLTQFDLTKLATISFGTNQSNPGTFKWEPSSENSHHMMGYLKWNGILEKNYKRISLDLNNIDNIPSRKFSWDKSNVTDKIFRN